MTEFYATKFRDSEFRAARWTNRELDFKFSLNSATLIGGKFNMASFTHGIRIADQATFKFKIIKFKNRQISNYKP
ncbi:hypothetical protein [Campylobacter sp.]|uniref:hypothetical protein n=1 Tax=Campylobacter sp. TaxID=205 RepID=UPI0025C698A7|nr:hypothetical protein [Campylobacter sp.]